MDHPSRRSVLGAAGLSLGALALPGVSAQAEASSTASNVGTVRARIHLSPLASRTAVTGRGYVILTRDSRTEPREQVNSISDGAPFWGFDLPRLAPGRAVVTQLNEAATGYPLVDAGALPPGRYFAQAFINTYTPFDRADGPTVFLHLPGGDGHDIFHSPGNLYGPVVEVTIDPASRQHIALDLTVDKVIPPIDQVPSGGTLQQGNPPESKHVKQVKIRSAALSRFWGRDMYVAATVLLPAGYHDEANRHVRYPLNIAHGHYTEQAPRGFKEDGSTDFSRYWLSGNAPKFIVVTIRHENPYFDDSYAVDSANVGPYGQAINNELLPAIEHKFRSFEGAWARILSGGSTGGWIVLATKLFYPKLYGGTWVGYPDPIDFSAMQVVNLYDDENAYETQHPYLSVEVPFAREINGKTRYTMRQWNGWERALGNRSRSGLGQYDIWQAVFSPRGSDGYPAAIFDKTTGVIDHNVANYWRTHYDLTDYTVRNWSKLRDALDGQLTIWVSETDNYFLNNGVHAFKARVDKLAGSNVKYLFGQDQPHHWIPFTNREFYDLIGDHVLDHAPAGQRAAATHWRAMVTTPNGSGSELLQQS